MKATGYIRRLNNCRIAIPKDVMRRMQISDITPIEVLVDGENIILRKYKAAENYVDTLHVLIETIRWDNALPNTSDIVNTLESAIKLMSGNNRFGAQK